MCLVTTARTASDNSRGICVEAALRCEICSKVANKMHRKLYFFLDNATHSDYASIRVDAEAPP